MAVCHFLLVCLCCEVTPELMKHLEDRFSGIVSTQAVEDCNGHMKNMGKRQGGKTFRTPTTALLTCVKHKVLTQRHKHKAPGMVLGGVNKTAALDSQCFKAEQKHESFNFGDIVSTKSETSWWSPRAKDMMAPHLDICLMQFCQADFASMNHGWLGGQCHTPVVVC